MCTCLLISRSSRSRSKLLVPLPAMLIDTTDMDFHEVLAQFIYDSSQCKSRLENLRGSIQQAWGDLLKLEATMRLFEDPEMLTRILREFGAVHVKKFQVPTFADASTQTARRNVTFSEEILEKVESGGMQRINYPSADFVDNPIVAQRPREGGPGIENTSAPSSPPKASVISDPRGDVKLLKTRSSCPASQFCSTSKAPRTVLETPRSVPWRVTANFVNTTRRIPAQKEREVEIGATPTTAVQLLNLRKSGGAIYSSSGKIRGVLASKERDSLSSENSNIQTRKPNVTIRATGRPRTAPNEKDANAKDPPPENQKISEVTKPALFAPRSNVAQSAALSMSQQASKNTRFHESMTGRGSPKPAEDSQSLNSTLTKQRIRGRVSTICYAEPSLRKKLRRD